MKSLKDISWNVSEEIYRADPALSYSTLARFEREGFHSVPKLFDKIESPSLTFGSAVDAIITGGMKEFDSKFIVCDYTITDGGVNVCNKLVELYGDKYENFSDIPQTLVSQAAQVAGFWKDPKWDKKRYSEVLKTGNIEEFYKIQRSADKTVLDRKTYDDVVAAVNALKSSDATRWYFEEDNPFDDVERFYQLKFKATFGGITYRCMADLIIVNYEDKTIQMCDLKTSGKPEYMFPISYVEWGYQLQNRLYAEIVEDNIKKDSYFKDFKMLPYLFIVVSRVTLNPLVWIFNHTFEKGSLRYGNVVMRDPLEVGKELHYYLTETPKVPIGIDETNPNDGVEWLKQHYEK